MPPLAGPPLHRQSTEDEWLHVLEGEITAEIDGERSILQARGSAFGQSSGYEITKELRIFLQILL